MALIDRDYAGKERQRLVNLIASIPADELWTELRDRDGTVDASNDSRPTFVEVPSGYLDVLRGPALFRRFEVRAGSVDDHVPQTIGATHDYDVHLEVRVGYPIVGGTLMPFPGAGPRMGEVATQDCTRIKQRLQDVANRQGGLTGPVYSGLPPAARRVSVRTQAAEPVVNEPPGRGGRMIWRIPVVSWIRASLEGP